MDSHKHILSKSVYPLKLCYLLSLVLIYCVDRLYWLYLWIEVTLSQPLSLQKLPPRPFSLSHTVKILPILSYHGWQNDVSNRLTEWTISFFLAKDVIFYFLFFWFHMINCLFSLVWGGWSAFGKTVTSHDSVRQLVSHFFLMVRVSLFLWFLTVKHFTNNTYWSSFQIFNFDRGLFNI